MKDTSGQTMTDTVRMANLQNLTFDGREDIRDVPELSPRPSDES